MQRQRNACRSWRNPEADFECLFADLLVQGPTLRILSTPRDRVSIDRVQWRTTARNDTGLCEHELTGLDMAFLAADKCTTTLHRKDSQNMTRSSKAVSPCSSRNVV